MPKLKTYDLFLSHVWRYSHHYDRLCDMLESAKNFYFRDYSVPISNPVVDPNKKISKTKLLALLDPQVKPVNCVLIMGGMYSHYSEWVEDEIKLAQKYNKPIIGIYPRGQEKMPRIIQQAADELVKWNTISIVTAIRKHSI